MLIKDERWLPHRISKDAGADYDILHNLVTKKISEAYDAWPQLYISFRAVFAEAKVDANPAVEELVARGQEGVQYSE